MRQKRGNYKTLEEYFYEKQRFPLERDAEMMKVYCHIDGLDKVRTLLLDAILNQQKICVFGDYDCDGITAAAQTYLLIWRIYNTYHSMSLDTMITTAASFGVQMRNPEGFLSSSAPKITLPYIPGRFSEGYGIKESSFDQMDCDLLITVDNGISAYDAMEKAKQKGIRTIILDHHIAPHGMPCADVVIDPEADPQAADFAGYCGAGLVFKLAEYILPEDKRLHTILSAFAALGTIADLVPVTGDNRRIIKTGLRALNERQTLPGISLLASSMEPGIIGTETASFKLAPAVNASGRLYDRGGEQTLQALLGSSPNLITALLDANTKRKTLVSMAYQQIAPLLLASEPFYFVYYQQPDGIDVSGIMGLLAGKIVEAKGKPAFCFTEKNGICHGSARSDDENANNVYNMLSLAKDYLLTFGGHAGAAGFTFAFKDMNAVKAAMLQYPVKPHEEPGYDFDLNPEDAEKALALMDRMEPFGKNMERPVFRVKAHFTGDQWWQPVSRNEDTENIRFYIPCGARSLQAVGFGLQRKYREDQEPKDLYLYGTLSWNEFRGNRSPQFLLDGYDIL